MKIEIHVYLHGDEDKVLAKLEELKTIVLGIRNQGGQIVAKVDELLAELGQVNATTNEIASDIDELLAQLAGGLTAAEAETVKAELVALKERLVAVAAKHPPVPPTPPA